jgi:hypothetical protein
MSKWPKTVIDWAHLVVMCGSGALVFLFLIVAVQTVFLGSDFKAWDFLAFMGSIIGGVITLAGVRITVNNQRNEDFLRTFAERLLSFDNVISNLHDLNNAINKFVMDKDGENLAKKAIQALSQDYKIESIKADVKVYNETLKYFLVFERIVHEYGLKELEDYSNDIRIKNAIHYSGELRARLNNILMIKSEFIDRYEKIANRK